MESEARIVAPSAAPAPIRPPRLLDLVFDRPFLIVLKKRHARRPFLAVWVENAEVLSRP